MILSPTDLPVLLLYNSDPAWSPADTAEITHLMDLLAGGLMQEGHPTQPVCLQDGDIKGLMANFDPNEVVVFNWCEEVPGIPRSASLVARALEEMGFTYTGTDSKALLLAQDKPAVKRALEKRDIPTPAWQLCTTAESCTWERFPAIVKPAFEHCSIGITHEAVVHDRAELEQRVEQASETYRQPVIVEDFIAGREFHVSIVGNGRLQVFPIAEMDFSAIPDPTGKLCTYDSKFAPDSSDYDLIQLRLPADLPLDEQRLLEKTALAAYKATNCRDYARLDIRQQDGGFQVLDINPNADLSPDTSMALSAELAGYNFGQFGSLLVSLAAKRHPVFGRKEPAQVVNLPVNAEV